MKRLLLLGLAFSIVLSSYPQKQFRSNKEFAKIHPSFNISPGDSGPDVIGLKDEQSVMVDRYEMGKSGNVYSVLNSYQRFMDYEPLTGTIMSTFRADPATYPPATGATVMAHTSTDDGINWNHIMVTDTASSIIIRNPSGLPYNYDGSGVYEDLYAVVAGSVLGSPHSIAISSCRMDESNAHLKTFPLESEIFPILTSMTAVPGFIYTFTQDYSIVGNLGEDQTMKHFVFSTDDPANGFELDTIYSYMPDWLTDPSDGHSVALYTNWSAWSIDGSIGYMWMIGVTNETYDYGVYQPQVAYTEDAGATWTGITLNLEDHPTLVEFLPPWEDAAGNPQTVRPAFLNYDRNYPGVVDSEGKLHLFSNVFGSSRGDVLNPDNGYWVVDSLLGGHIFDFIIDQNGLVDIIFVDSVRTEVAPDNAFGDVSWDHRLQASKSVDEQVVFCVWCEDTDEAHAEVLNPDIKGWGYVIPDERVLETQNFTTDDLYAGFYFYHSLSELTPKFGDFLNLPISTSLTITEYNSNNPLAPVTHTYLLGLGWTTYSSIEDNTTQKGINLTVSQNIPNPASGNTSIEISSSTIAPVTVEVSNMIGQTVQTVNAGLINGSMKVNLDVSNLEAGVYFYTVTIANERVSKRMIVK